MRELKIFSGRANRPLSEKICQFLNLKLAKFVLRLFPTASFIARLKTSAAAMCFWSSRLVHRSTITLMELLIMIDACLRASAERITAVIPYYGYARQDRKDEGRVPITAKLVANMITRAGADRVLTMDLHAAQIQGFFDVPVDHLYAATVLEQLFSYAGICLAQTCASSVRTKGSIKRAVGHAKRLGGEDRHHRQTANQRRIR